jgi:hypothetical protein
LRTWLCAPFLAFESPHRLLLWLRADRRTLRKRFLYRAPQRFHFRRRKLPVLPFGKIAKLQRAEPHALRFLDRKIFFEERLPQFVTPRAAHFRFVPRIDRMARTHRGIRRGQRTQTRLRLVRHFGENVRRGPPLQLDPEDLHQARGNLENRIGKLAVAGEQD